MVSINLRDNTTGQRVPALTGIMQVGNRPLAKLMEDNPNLLVFSPRLDAGEGDEQGLNDLQVLSFYPEEDGNLTVSTGNLMGFIGVGDVEINIKSRFANDAGDDFFLHHMLRRVFSFSMVDWDHSTDYASQGFDWRLYFFPYYLSEALRQGIYKEYRTSRHNDARVRGTVDVARHIRLNIPFLGKMAYSTREHSHDNPVIQLVRHTIEYMRRNPLGKTLLKSRVGIADDVSQIIAATQTYDARLRAAVIKENMHKPVRHPYFFKYKDLQALCLQILLHENLRYADTGREKVHGILFDGAWLWEEYLNEVFNRNNLGLKHPRNKSGEGAIYLATDSRLPRYPDFYKQDGDRPVVLDAKYKRYRAGEANREDINQLITYLYRLKCKFGAFVLPTSNPSAAIVSEKWNLLGYGNGETTLAKISLLIPQHADDPEEFTEKMSQNEQSLIRELKKII